MNMFIQHHRCSITVCSVSGVKQCKQCHQGKQYATPSMVVFFMMYDNSYPRFNSELLLLIICLNVSMALYNGKYIMEMTPFTELSAGLVVLSHATHKWHGGGPLLMANPLIAVVHCSC